MSKKERQAYLKGIGHTVAAIFGSAAWIGIFIVALIKAGIYTI